MLTTDSMLSTIHYFFLCGYADHRDLHSFPTRRSSDLGSSRPVNHRPTCPDVMTRASSPARAISTRARVTRKRYSSRDRKSTRLNSSHSQISYAVFCLKKKKMNDTISTVMRHTVNDTNP